MPVKVHALDHIAINVADVARTVEWYCKILGMEARVFDPGGGKAPRISLSFGDQKKTWMDGSSPAMTCGEHEICS